MSSLKFTALFTGAFLCLSLSLFSQPDNSEFNNIGIPSPNAASLGEYADVPVDYASGLPSIGIPITTVSEGPLSVGVSINYHAGGVRVAENSSWVGLGWTLNAGGMISRSVVGLRDEATTGYFYSGSNNTPPSEGVNNSYYQHVCDVFNGNADGEPDLFTVIGPGISGKFFFDKDGKIQLINRQSDIKIIQGVASNRLEQFIVVAPNGVRYLFGKSGSTTAYETMRSGTGGVEYRSGWMLLRMETLDSRLGIDFEYSPEGYNFKTIATGYQAQSNDLAYFTFSAFPGSNGVINNGAGQFNYIIQYVNGQRLNRISSTTETIDFIPSSLDREDIDGGAKYLSEIKCSTGNGAYCSSHHFSQSYFVDKRLGENNSSYYKRLKLDAITQKSCDNSIVIPAHTFEYFGPLNSDGVTAYMPNRLSKASDHWGYFNGEYGNNALTLNIPATQIPNPVNPSIILSYGTANRNSAELFMKYGSIKKINYPTGGFAEYNFEGNTVVNTATTQTFTLINNLSSCATLGAACCGSIDSLTNATTHQFLSQEEIDNAYFDLLFTDPYPGQSLECPDVDGFGPQAVKIEVLENDTIIGEYGANVPSNGTISNTIYIADDVELCEIVEGLIVGVSYTFKISSRNGKGEFKLFSESVSAENEVVGGLRIQELRLNDGIDAANDIVRSFEYVSEGNPTLTSGSLYWRPTYVSAAGFLDDDCDSCTQEYNYIARFTETSANNITGYDGRHMSYRKVTEFLNGVGSKEYFYYFAPVSNTDFTTNFSIGNSTFMQFSFPIASNFNHLQGQSFKQTTKDENGGVVASSESTSSGYTRNLGSGHALRVAGVICKGITTTTPNQPVPASGNAVLANPYQPRGGAALVGTVVNVLDGVSTISTTEFDSGDSGYPRFHSPIVQSISNSDGKVYTTKSKFAPQFFDDGFGNIYDVMYANYNLVSIPLETIKEVDGIQVDGNRTLFDYFNGTPRPETIEKYELSWEPDGTPSPQIGDGWRALGVFEGYTTNGFPASFRRTGWEPESFSWSTDGRLLGKSFKDHTSQYSYHWDTKLVSTMTDIDGQTVGYSYDKLKRLISATARNGNVRGETQYNFPAVVNANSRPSIKSSYIFPSGSGSGLVNRHSYTYVDGLGRAIQTVDQSYSDESAPKDVFKAVIYDQFGRAVESYDPIKSSVNTGDFISILPIGTQYKTVTRYETSPLGRVLGVTPPSWHETTTTYGNNSQAMIIAGVNYPAGSLMTTSVLDPNFSDGSLRDIEFKDKLGRVVLTRRTDGTTNNDTQYLYDDKGRLVTIVPPGATTNDPGLIYQYVYDERDQVVKKKIPDQDWIYFMYSTRNLVTYTQDGNMRAAGRWMHSHYDDYGRKVASGFVDDDPVDGDEVKDFNLSLTRSCYDGCAFTGTAPTIYKGKLQRSEARVLGTNQWLSQTIFYDQYGRVSRTEGNNILNLEKGDAEDIRFQYDFADNVLEQLRTHSGVGNSIISLTDYATFDHAGRLSASDQEINGNRFKINDLTYTVKDQTSRKMLGYSSGSWLQQVDFEYKPNGFLEAINPGPLSDASIIGVSNCGPDVPDGGSPTTSVSQNDLFQLELFYDTLVGTGVSSTLQKNGNISGIRWRTRGRQYQTYSFEYDYLNRLKSSTHAEKDNNNVYSTNNYNNWLTYDERGNITSLMRNGKAFDAGGCLVQGEIDDLSYSYSAGTNRLVDITDNANNSTNNSVLKPSGYSGYNTTATGEDYKYDLNGNMIYDPSKKLTIYYNYLNLPERFEFEDCRVMVITYDAAGTKLRQELSNGQRVITSRTYAGGIEYNNGVLEAIYHAEGRTYFEGATSRQEFNLSDHLGNRRLTYSDLNGNGRIDMTTDPETNEILSEQNYYPFGMEMAGNWLEDEGRASNYRYNGIEHVEELVLDLAMFRSYDAAIGRWLQVDPLAELAPGWTPFRFGFNNPIYYKDPLGLFESRKEAKKFRRFYGLKGRVKRTSKDKDGNKTFAFTDKKSGSEYTFGSVSAGNFTDQSSIAYPEGTLIPLSQDQGIFRDATNFFRNSISAFRDKNSLTAGLYDIVDNVGMSAQAMNPLQTGTYHLSGTLANQNEKQMSMVHTGMTLLPQAKGLTAVKALQGPGRVFIAKVSEKQVHNFILNRTSTFLHPKITKVLTGVSNKGIGYVNDGAEKTILDNVLKTTRNSGAN